MYEIIIIIVFITRRLVKDHEDGREIPFQRGNQADTGIDPKGGRQDRDSHQGKFPVKWTSTVSPPPPDLDLLLVN